MLRCLFHAHTWNSCDSLLAPAAILARATELAVDVLIVTDHNTLRGAREVSMLAYGRPVFVVRAAEYSTEKGDIIGLFLNEEILSRLSAEVVRQIHAQDGLAVLPHPFKAHDLEGEWLNGFDLIETHNSRCSPAQNASARGLAERLGKPCLGGADAHFRNELDTVLTEFDTPPPKDEAGLRDILLRSPRTIRTRAASAVYRPASQMIKAVRARNPWLFLSQAKRLATVVVRERWGQQNCGST